MTFRTTLVLAVASGVLLVSGDATAVRADSEGSEAKAKAEKSLVYEDHVAPLLEKHCHDCHNPDDRKGGLDLTTAAGLMEGSASGPVVLPQSRDRSLLYEMLHSGEMPREAGPLAEEEIERIGRWIAGGARFRDPPEAVTQAPTQHDVVPILLLRCTACHGAELQRGGLDLRTVAGLREGGENGPVAVPGDPDASPMIERIESKACPPKGQLLKYFVERPTSTELETLREWIAAGMPEEDLPDDVASGMPDPRVTDADRQHWAFQPLPEEVAVPVSAGAEPLQPVDAFIDRRLRDEGLGFSPPAERTVLIRRVYLDLIGMPPSLEELDRWEHHPGADWYAEMVDHLLASPKYGERWGRYWLDVAGYSDSEGGQSADTVREFAWKYRDYVIRSFNEDKPWDRFLLEQIAGDELADYTDPQQVTEDVVDNLIATGFLRMTVDETGSRTMNFVPERLGLIADAIDVLSSGVMGLTMECARCHNHKYDPIPQRDYYRFKAIFQGAFDEHDWMSWRTRKLEVETPEHKQRRQTVNPPLKEEISELESRRKKLVKDWQDRYYEDAWPQLSEKVQREIKEALDATAGRRTLRQEELVERYRTEIRPTEAVLVRRHAELAGELDAIDGRLAELRDRLLPEPTIRALWDRGRPSPTYVLIRGEHDRPGRRVGPGVPSVLTDGETPFVPEPPPDADSTGRRLAFAKWLTEPDHPLTARVLVNRVWHHHFGRGIVKTLDNFGAQGADPTHPELLDWLAREFINRGWSLKELHRMILLSRTYRQLSARTPDRDRIDPQNKLLSRMTLRRLDAEALRDSVLFVSGRLDERMFGPPSPVSVRDDGLIMEKKPRDGLFRRSVYLRLRRTEMPTLLSSFDYPEMQPNCTRRTTSTVSTQSLILKNNERIHELAGSFAGRLLRRARVFPPTSQADAKASASDRKRSAWEADPATMVRLVYRSALSRSPDAEELAEGREALAEFRHRWRESGADEEAVSRLALTTFCHTILNSAEFLYVD